MTLFVMRTLAFRYLLRDCLRVALPALAQTRLIDTPAANLLLSEKTEHLVGLHRKSPDLVGGENTLSARPVALQVHSGDWHTASGIYRSWFRPAFHH